MDSRLLTLPHMECIHYLAGAPMVVEVQKSSCINPKVIQHKHLCLLLCLCLSCALALTLM